MIKELQILATKPKNKVELYMALLIIVNIVNFFVPRISVEGGTARVVTQLLFIIIAGVISSALLFRKLDFKAMIAKLLSIVLVVFIFVGFFKTGSVGAIVHTVKNYVFYISFLFLLTYGRKYSCNDVYVKVYILTLIALQIFRVVQSDTLGLAVEYGSANGGDTASICFAFLIPFVFVFFKDRRLQMFLAFAMFLAALYSMRRTALLCISISLFISLPYIRNKINKRVLLLLLIGLVLVSYYIWNYTVLGMYLNNRLLDTIVELNTIGTQDSVGRGEWLMRMYNEMIAHPFALLFGFGPNSVSSFLRSQGYPFSHAHNDYFQIWFSYGLFFLILHLSFFMILFKDALNIGRRSRALSCPLIGMIIAFLIIGMLSGFITDVTSVCLPICLCFGINKLSQ